jgi:hypothetical protein
LPFVIERPARETSDIGRTAKEHLLTTASASALAAPEGTSPRCPFRCATAAECRRKWRISDSLFELIDSLLRLKQIPIYLIA